MARSHAEVAPERSVLGGDPEAAALLQGDEGLGGEALPVLLQKAPLKVRQHPVHVHQDPEPPTGWGGSRVPRPHRTCGSPEPAHNLSHSIRSSSKHQPI